MTGPVRIDWRGPQVAALLDRATREAIDGVMTEAVLHARTHHAWRNRTGVAEGSIRIVHPARSAGGRLVGEWGSLGVVYFARLEFGFEGVDRRGRVILQSARPALRPAAERIYPRLPARIRQRVRAIAAQGR